MLNREFQKVLKCFPVLIEKSLYASEHFAVLFMALIAPTGLLATLQDIVKLVAMLASHPNIELQFTLLGTIS